MVNFCDDRISNDEAFEDYFLQGILLTPFLLVSFVYNNSFHQCNSRPGIQFDCSRLA